MRFIILLLLIISTSASIAQTGSKSITMADPEFNAYFYNNNAPTVSGKIINASPDELKNLSITYSKVIPFEGFQENGTCIIKEDGSFSFQLDYPLPYQQVWFRLGDYFYSGIYLNKGLVLELDFAQLKKNNVFLIGSGAKYLGADGPVTEYLNKFVLFRRDEQLSNTTTFNRLDFNGEHYISKLDSLQKLNKNIEVDFIQQNPSHYSWMLENERLSEYYAALLRHGLYNDLEPAKWKEINQHKPATLSNNSGSFFQALYSYLFSRRTKGKYLAMARMTDIPNIDPVILKASDMNIRVNEVLLDSLQKIVKTPWVKTVLQKQHDQALKRLSEINLTLKTETKLNNADTILGEPIAEFPFGGKLYNANDMTAAEFLAKLTSKFKDKAMVVDIWATWCGPCINGMPVSAKLHHQTTDLPLEFVYLCTNSGSNLQIWKDKIIEMKQPGTHVFINDKLTNDLMAMFKKGGYPSYICFDSNGEVSKDLSISSIHQVSIADLKKLVVK